MRNVKKKKGAQQKQGIREDGGMQEVGTLVSLCKTFKDFLVSSHMKGKWVTPETQ